MVVSVKCNLFALVVVWLNRWGFPSPRLTAFDIPLPVGEGRGGEGCAESFFNSSINFYHYLRFYSVESGETEFLANGFLIFTTKARSHEGRSRKLCVFEAWW